MSSETQAVIEAMQSVLSRGEAFTLCTVIDTQGSSPRKAGAKMLLDAKGLRLAGTIGGGAVENQVQQAAIGLADIEQRQYALTRDLAMCCGGSMTVLFEPYAAQDSLIVFGGGHVGLEIVRLAQAANFKVHLVDDLESNTDQAPKGVSIHPSFHPGGFDRLPFGPRCAIVIATREHSIDQNLLEAMAKKEWFYLGCIASQRKAGLQRKRLSAKSIADEIVASMDCPMGLNIGAQTPFEIAISVVAKLIKERSRDDQRPKDTPTTTAAEGEASAENTQRVAEPAPQDSNRPSPASKPSSVH